MKLSILIPTTDSRKIFLSKLLYKFSWQAQFHGLDKDDVEILTEYGNETTGEKRNRLIQKASGDYIAFVDDDDDVTDNYLKLLLEAIKTNPTHCSLLGLYIEHGLYRKPFIHSTAYNKAWEDSRFYYRAPNHLNCIKRSLVVDIPFQHKSFGEDGCWMEDLFKSGRLNKEKVIPELLYLYYKQ